MRWRLVSSAVPAVREIEEISISKGEKGRLRLDIRKKKMFAVRVDRHCNGLSREVESSSLEEFKRRVGLALANVV